MWGFAMAAALAAAPAGEAMEAAGPSGRLSGTLVRPAGKGPALLIIPGSGPTDRDGNSPLGVKASTYRLLAEGLAGQGVATVRIDKRGMFASAGAAVDANAVTIPDYVADTGAWLKAVRAKTGLPCVWLLGHSEGGLVALAAAREVEGICGLILVAAPGRRVSAVLREQLQAGIPEAAVVAQAGSAIDRLEKGERVDATGLHPGLAGLFAPQVQSFLISLFSYDPVKLAASYSGPILILQGQRDIQVPVADARRLEAAHPAARLVLLPEVNHVLKAVATEDRAANAAAYADPDLPLAPGVVEAIAAFVKAGGT